MIYLIEYNQKTVGVYKSYEKAELFILSCLQNNLMNGSAKIHEYESDSGYCVKTNTVTHNKLNNKSVCFENILPKQIKESKPQKPQKTTHDHEDPNVVKIANEKLDLQHKINLLKIHKQKIEESKKIYVEDLKLYNMFKNNHSNDNKFVIPELFKDKYEIMNMLEKEDKLSWENFSNNYKKETYYGDYFGVNSYEEHFMDPESDNSDISEELDIESDSETETSNDDM